jgi:CelD/BcsL family acetyltransferase involved in cellulose biosynthesis
LRVEPSRIGPVRRIGFPLDNWGSHYGPLGDQPAETLAAALRYLSEQRREWDVIDLRWVPAELGPEFVRGWRQAGLNFQQKLWSRTSGIDLSRGWNDFWNQRTSKWRNNQRRGDKLLARMGAVEVVHFRPPRGTPDPRWDLYDLCEQVAGDSWQGACTTGNTLNHPAVRDFLRDLHAIAVREGAVYLSLLLVDDCPAAFTYNYHFRGTTFGLRTGYQPEYQTAGPGAVLMRETVRDCCRVGDRLFHLGESPSAYKRHVANCEFETFQFCHYSPASPRGHALRLKALALGFRL